MARQVNTTYGNALFEVAMENNTLDTTLEEVTFVKQSFLENEDLMKLLLHPNIEKESKISVVESIYKGKISDELTGLLTMLINKGHQKDIISVFDYVINAIKDYTISYPVVFDWETVNAKSARTNDVTVDTLSECCIAFCERVKEAGYTPMIYQNKDIALRKLDLPRLKDYDFWLAEYNDKPTYRYHFDMWQFGQNGYIKGIEGDVDMNISFHDYGDPLPEIRSATPTEPPVIEEIPPVENYEAVPPANDAVYEEPAADYQENYYEEPVYQEEYQDYNEQEYYPPAEEYYPENDYQW